MPNFAKYFSFTAGSKDVFGEFVVDRRKKRIHYVLPAWFYSLTHQAGSS